MKPFFFTMIAFVLIISHTVQAQEQPAFKKGERAPGTTFTGTVWVNYLIPNDSTFNCAVGHVTFEAGARSFWHTHQAGQFLLVTAGQGYIQERGKPVQLIQKGDVVICKAGVEHWHGATPGSSMTHIAINPNTENGLVTWLKPVTDAEYPKK